jgi:hypothetical protein
MVEHKFQHRDAVVAAVGVDGAGFTKEGVVEDLVDDFLGLLLMVVVMVVWDGVELVCRGLVGSLMPRVTMPQLRQLFDWMGRIWSAISVVSVTGFDYPSGVGGSWQEVRTWAAGTEVVRGSGRWRGSARS